jgi:hypothetical protein
VLDRRPGDVSGVKLLDDGGTGIAYESPGLAMSRLRQESRRQRGSHHYYVQLKAGFWQQGWVAELSAAAVAMYLVVLHEQRGDDKQAVWIAPSVGRQTYGLSDDTRGKGLAELVNHELLVLSRESVHRGSFEGRHRARNVYELDPRRLDDPPAQGPLY